jgi:hypothetical protein
MIDSDPETLPLPDNHHLVEERKKRNRKELIL